MAEPGPSPPASPQDIACMAQALALGRSHLGQVAPNPSVGALVVRAGAIVGRGVTRAGGRPHAETIALDAAGAAARGATLYVTLEPCSHTGKTGPCADAVIKAGIARVVSAMQDPDPRVSGHGHARLRAAGIEVVVGVEGAAALRANLGHVLRVTQGRPMVTLKLAETRDGFAAGDEHDARLMITGALANQRTHEWRAAHDAIMVGIGTVLADDPLMTVRWPGEPRQPKRIVLDTHLRLPLSTRLVATLAEAPVWVLAGQGAPVDRVQALEALGVEVFRLAETASGHVDLAAALQLLAQKGLTRIFSEGGPRVAAALIGQGFADACIFLTSARPLGRAGVEALAGPARQILADAARYTLASDEMLGQDRMRIYERVIA